MIDPNVGAEKLVSQFGLLRLPGEARGSDRAGHRARPRSVADVARQRVGEPVDLVDGRHRRDVDHLYRYLAEKLSTIDGITTYDVSIRTQRLKQTASLISHGRLIQAGRTW